MTRRRLMLALVVVLVVGLALGDLFGGSFAVSLSDVWSVVTGEDIPGVTFIVMDNKLPRIVLALGVGMAFGVSGVLTQSLLGNSLASPDILGVSGGASASVVMATSLFPGIGFMPAGLAGAFAAAGLVLVFSRDSSGHWGVGRLVLSGIALSAMAQALIMFLLQKADLMRAQEALVWLTGSLSLANWTRCWVLAVSMLFALPWLLVLRRGLDALMIGSDFARSVGVSVARLRWVALSLAVFLAAMATSVAGPVASVAFLAGVISRMLVRGRVSFALAAGVGSALMLLADGLAEQLVPGATLPVGVVTGAAGAPFLLWLLGQRRRSWLT